MKFTAVSATNILFCMPCLWEFRILCGVDYVCCRHIKIVSSPKRLHRGILRDVSGRRPQKRNAYMCSSFERTVKIIVAKLPQTIVVS